MKKLRNVTACRWQVFLSACLLSLTANAAPAPTAVATFECLSLYWSPAEGATDVVCETRYRVRGSADWEPALPLWFDTNRSEYRGSIVGLVPGKSYEIKLDLQGAGTTVRLAAKTWPANFPIAKNIVLPKMASETLVIDVGGRADGYVLYTGPEGGDAVIDVVGKAEYCVQVKAPYIIIRGLVLKNAGTHGVFLDSGSHDVVVEKCDISGWGRIAPDGLAAGKLWGHEMDGGIRTKGPENCRIVVQRNRIHDPRSAANNWSELRATPPYDKDSKGHHPNGPEGIVFMDSDGNNVIRYNEVWSDDEHCFNDGISGAWNGSTRGFPGKDSDVYGNTVQNVWDDALEIDGGGCNVRIWGNYLDTFYCGISVAPATLGPIYLFRNVFGLSRTETGRRNVGFKMGDLTGKGVGKKYMFHNTVLQPSSRGCYTALSSCGSGIVIKLTSRNNLFDEENNTPLSIEDLKSPDNNLDYDFCNGRVKQGGVEAHGILTGSLVYAAGSGPESVKLVHTGTDPIKGMFQLAASSPGYQAAIALPNFNTQYAKPDMGAHQAGTAAMEFGVNAYCKGVK